MPANQSAAAVLLFLPVIWTHTHTHKYNICIYITPNVNRYMNTDEHAHPHRERERPSLACVEWWTAEKGWDLSSGFWPVCEEINAASHTVVPLL